MRHTVDFNFFHMNHFSVVKYVFSQIKMLGVTPQIVLELLVIVVRWIILKVKWIPVVFAKPRKLGTCD